VSGSRSAVRRALGSSWTRARGILGTGRAVERVLSHLRTGRSSSGSQNWWNRHRFLRGRRSMSDYYSSIPSTSSVWASRSKRVVAYIKAKKDQYVTSSSSGALEPDDDHMAYRMASFPSIELPNEPSKDENMVLYPSYSRELSNGEYEVDVRGWLFLPGVPNRKSRLISMLARQMAGIGNSSPSDTESIMAEVDMVERQNEEDLIDIDQPKPFSSRTSSSLSTATAISEDAVLKERLANLLARPAPNRQLNICVGLADHHSTDGPLISRFVTTLSNGRFLARIKVPYKPSLVQVEAGEHLSATIQNINIDSRGISVISDIDDTIKHTGITGDKRQMFRNVFVRDYQDISIEGVSDWYSKLYTQGVRFHYVSNAPWGLYPVINAYLKSANLPPGSIHLKQYNGIINGLFEPSAEKKRITLYNIVRDFPNRKFILIGDSGEGDLEAYCDLAIQYPRQILAIYIRDVTLPIDDMTSLGTEMLLSSACVPRPSEIDRYQSIKKSTSDSVIPDLIDLTDEPGPLKSAVSRRVPPPVPRKPVGLRPYRELPTPSTQTKAAKRATDVLGDQLQDKANEIASEANSQKKNQRSDEANYRKNKNEDPNTPNYQKSMTPVSASGAVNVKPEGTVLLETESTSEREMAVSSEPPPLPPRPPPKPPRPRQAATEPIMMPSSQNDYGQYEILDKRVENWKTRVTRIRQGLPPGVRLRMWRTGNDVKDECFLIVGDNGNKNT
jgi:phosphatidate phosphatase APP1